jgi:hypothetical protein
MNEIRFEPSIMGATVYYKDGLICQVSGMEDAERLQRLFLEKQKRLDSIETALKELIDAVVNMDIQKQKEAIRLAKRNLNVDV